MESLIFFQNFSFQSFAFLQSLWNAFHYKLLQEIFKYSNLNISIVKILSFQNFEICKFSNFFTMFCTLSSWNLAFFPFQKFTFAKKFITFSILGILAFLSSLILAKMSLTLWSWVSHRFQSKKILCRHWWDRTWALKITIVLSPALYHLDQMAFYNL